MTAANKWTSILVMLTLALSMTRCKVEESLPANIQMFVSPDTLVLSDTSDMREIFLSTKPKGSVDFVMTHHPAWLTPSITEGTIGKGIFPIELVPNTSGLNEGVYHSKISFISDYAGTSIVDVYMNVGSHPNISVDKTSFSFQQGTLSAVLKIKNIGTGMLDWHLNDLPKWMYASNTSGYLLKGEQDVITLTCMMYGKEAGVYEDSLIFLSNSENVLPGIPVKMTVPETVQMAPVGNSILFDYFSTRKTVKLANTGNQPISWNLSSSPEYLKATPISGTLAKGDTASITVTIDRTNLTTGTSNANLVFKNQVGDETTIAVTTNHYKSTLWSLDRSIIDAEYVKSTDKLVIISSNPNRLSILNPETKDIVGVDLSTTPKCVSVNAEGTMAVVGHNGYVSYVDLTTNQVVHIWPIACDSWDITLGKNNWCYVTPNEDQWVTMYSMNGATGAVSTAGSIYEKSMIKVQPNSNYLYLCNTTGSSTAIEKCNITNGSATYLYENYDASTGGRFWYSNDGSRIFTYSKRTYSTSDVKANDLTYRGSVESSTYLYWVDHSAAAKKLFTIGTTSLYYSTTNSQVDYYNDTYLNYQGSITLEPFFCPSGLEGGKLYNAEGKYVFANQAGTRLYVLVQATSSAPLTNNWAIQRLNVPE